MKILRLSFALLLMGAFSIFTLAQDVHTDWDKHAAFEKYHTYCWGKVQTTNPLWKSRIQDAIDKQLQAKGWQRIDSRGDVTVFAIGSTQNEKEYQTFYDNMGGGWRWGGFGESTTTVQNYKIGSLVVDLYDSNNKQLLFRGMATDTLSEKPEKNEKKLDTAVEKMFKKFPPDKS